MLNISKQSVGDLVSQKHYEKLSGIQNRLAKRVFIKILLGLFLFMVILLFMPWTQHIQITGEVNALRPDERPQTIQNTIAGKIDKWYVQEGDFVEAGDTILRLTEIKAEYFDPQLITRVKEQVDAKAKGIEAYEDKLKALDDQLHSLSALQKFGIQSVDNKVQQAQFQVISDSASWQRAQIEYETAKKRLERQEKLYEQGLISLTDLETRRLKLQETKAKAIELENKYGLSVNKYINALIEQDRIVSEYASKIAEVQSKRSSAGTELYEGLSDMAKMKNQLTNYEMRQAMYYVLAPRRGFLTKALEAGVGENIKESTPIMTIVPQRWVKAVEAYVSPTDMPLVHRGNKMMLMFDGWPTTVFSGWPELSYGTFPGEVYAIDYSISKNGMYRILVVESEEKPWPKDLRIGSGSRGIALLNRVPIWYELWRQLNGFPPDFYQPSKPVKHAKKH
jgi:multidrug resistance efflux pump